VQRIFITGATGFIGGRLAEVACQRSIPVVALVRTWSRAARLARLSAQLTQGDVLDATGLEDAMRGCDVVFHCAVDNRSSGARHRRISVTGTENVMRAAAAVGARRVVHVSSTAVFGYKPDADAATEAGAYRYSSDDYCDGKIDSEKAALAAHRDSGLPVTVLRPTIVYGPFGDYSRDTVRLVRQGRMMLIDGGRGICNALYVDNLVDAMLLAASSDRAVGEIFHISDAAPVTWRDFIEGHAQAVKWPDPLPELTTDELKAARRAARPSSIREAVRVAHDPVVRRSLRRIPFVDRSVKVAEAAARTLIPPSAHPQVKAMLFGQTAVVATLPRPAAPPPQPAPLEPAEELMITAFDRVAFSIDKARQRLGYAPAIDFREGMRRTSAWIQWARL
jgi:nucleoside-diphosphate-sugar epimerase